MARKDDSDDDDDDDDDESEDESSSEEETSSGDEESSDEESSDDDIDLGNVSAPERVCTLCCVARVSRIFARAPAYARTRTLECH